jgi:hypothetical protein
VFAKKRGVTQKASDWTANEATANLTVSTKVAGQIIPNKTSFTFAANQIELDEFSLIAGKCEYIGREGIQFYPQELQVFRYDSPGHRPGTVWLRNIQVQKAQHKVPPMRVLLETTYLRPLITAPLIETFGYRYDGLLVAFPYDAETPTKPIEPEILADTSPFLLAYYKKHRETIESLSSFNTRIRGPNPGAFYGLARTGPYSFADAYIAFRKDTKWCATVVSSQPTPWGRKRQVVFQSHAVSMCEREDGKLIDEDEAHYICAIFNAPVVERFIAGSSDNRSFNVRPPICVPLYNRGDRRHARLTAISREAHLNSESIDALRAESEDIYLSLCREEAYDAEVARSRLDGIEDGTVILRDGDGLQKELDRLLVS